MKILGVEANRHRQAFEVRTRRADFRLPFAECDPRPSRSDPPVTVIVDAELGNEAFTYELSSGAEGSVHLDAVLEYNRDPAHMAELALYRLTCEVREAFDRSPLSAREVARRLTTSPAQIYRLLDPTNYTKSLKQMVSLLYVLGYDLGGVTVRRRRPPRTQAGLR